ncbi:hypothetical protein QYF36_018574 [Acer negundo]|nr:hypothetical protein QYF36_018574 [Acer negundo]
MAGEVSLELGGKTSNSTSPPIGDGFRSKSGKSFPPLKEIDSPLVFNWEMSVPLARGDRCGSPLIGEEQSRSPSIGEDLAPLRRVSSKQRRSICTDCRRST